jgi:hypothetical protein
MLLTELITEETNPQQSEDNVFNIPEWKMDEFTRRIEKINARATRLGAAPVRVTNLGAKRIKDPRVNDPDLKPNEIPEVNIFKMKLEGDPPKLAGWTFLGVLDHNTIPGQVVVQTVPGHSIPQQFFNAPPVCDHCNKRRNRNETFVLQHEGDGKFMKVGRMCLRDFLGHDPTRAVQALQALFDVAKEMGNQDNWGGGGHMDWTYDMERVLALTAAVISQRGWIPRAAASEDRNPTSSDVSYLLNPPTGPRSEEPRRLWRQAHETLQTDAEKWKTEAQAAIAWLKEQPENQSEYMHNLQLIAKAGTVPSKMLGYWVSLMAAYHRAQERLNLNKATQKKNEYVGAVGDKIEANIMVTRIHHFESAYGMVHMHQMLDDQGRTLIWYANTDKAGMSPQKRYKIKGTIKKQDEYNNWKQTHLTRVKVLEELPDEQKS